MKTVIFARLSTQEQEAEGHSIDAQTAKLPNCQTKGVFAKK